MADTGPCMPGIHVGRYAIVHEAAKDMLQFHRGQPVEESRQPQPAKFSAAHSFDTARMLADAVQAYRGGMSPVRYAAAWKAAKKLKYAAGEPESLEEAFTQHMDDLIPRASQEQRPDMETTRDKGGASSHKYRASKPSQSLIQERHARRDSREVAQRARRRALSRASGKRPVVKLQRKIAWTI